MNKQDFFKMANNGHGGKREGAGRPSKAEEQKARFLFTEALKRIYKSEEDNEAKIQFIETLSESQRGQIFIAEHLFGKAPQTLDVNTSIEGTIPIDEWLKSKQK